MKICKGWLQALLSPAPRGFAARSRVLARLASLAQIGELARRLSQYVSRRSDRSLFILAEDREGNSILLDRVDGQIE